MRRLLKQNRPPQSATIRRFFWTSIGFGLTMGLVFPFYALIFASFPSDLALTFFSLGCLGAGLVVGGASYFIGKTLILDWIEKRTRSLGEINQEGSLIDLEKSRQLGEISQNFNKFFTGLDRGLKRIKKSSDQILSVSHILQKSFQDSRTGLNLLDVNSRLGGTSLQTLTDKIQETTKIGGDLAQLGTRVYTDLLEEEKLFQELSDCSLQVAEAQTTMAELTSDEYRRNQELMEKLKSTEHSYHELLRVQLNLKTIFHIFDVSI